jgi:uroporphyrinogen decarboxylase
VRVRSFTVRRYCNHSLEFRQVRKDHDFFELCRNVELATTVTLQPITRYSGLVDAAIVFSDILVVPQAMGMEVVMNPGPHFPSPLVTPSDVEKLNKHPDLDKELGYVYDVISSIRKELDGRVPLFGFCGGPWTLFSYMIEGGGSKTFTKAKTWIFKYPGESKNLIMLIADVCADFLIGQARAGAQVNHSFLSA